MGDYTIVIRGHGINHNGTPKDADEIAAAAVATLRASGQSDVEAFFVYGVDLTRQLKDTMPVGEGARRLEPLFPLCEEMVRNVLQAEPRQPPHVWDERCKRLATTARVSTAGFAGMDLYGFTCDEHRKGGDVRYVTLRHMDEPAKAIRGVV